MNALAYTNRGIKTVIEQIDLAVAQIVMDSVAVQYFNYYEEKRYLLVRRLDENFKNVFGLNPQIRSFSIINLEKELYYSTRSGVRELSSYPDSNLVNSLREEGARSNEILIRTFEDEYSSGPEKVLTFIKPIPLLHFSPKAFLVLNMKDTLFQDIVSSVSQSPTFSMLIMNQKVNIASAGLPIDAEQILPTLIELISEGAFQENSGEVYSIAGKKYLVSFKEADYYNLQVIALVPYSRLLQNIQTVRTFVVLLTIGGFVLILATAYVVARRFFKPVKQLAELLGSGAEEEVPSLSLLRRNIASIIQTQEGFRKKLQLYIPYMQQSLLLRLLRGDYEDLHHMKTELEETGFTLLLHRWYVPCHLIITLRNHGEQLSVTNEYSALLLVKESLEKQMSSRYSSFFVEHSATELTLMVESESAGMEIAEDLKNIFLQVYRFISKSFNFDFTVCVGEFVHAHDLSLAYQSVSKTAQYNNLINLEHVTLLAETGKQHVVDFDYPYVLERNIIDSLKSNSDAKWQRSLNDFFSVISSGGGKYLRFILLQLLSSIMRFTHDLGKGFAHYFESPTLYSDIMSLNDTNAAENWFRSLLSEIHKGIQERKDNRNSEIMSKVAQLVEENLSEELSLSWISERVYLSESYVSRLFKEHTGEKLKQYINRKRIEKACKLLKESNETIKNIGEKVGYSQSQSFIKLFKTYVHMTPGEYRCRST